MMKKKLQANILEPLVALVIVLVSLTASFTVVFIAKQNMNVVQLTRANALAAKLLHECKETNNFLEEELEIDGLFIEKEISWYNKNANLLQIRISVFDVKERLLSQRQQIIIRQ